MPVEELLKEKDSCNFRKKTQTLTKDNLLSRRLSKIYLSKIFERLGYNRTEFVQKTVRFSLSFVELSENLKENL